MGGNKMSDTPQTDSAVEDTILHDRNHPRIDWVPASFARKLERERDEALSQIAQAEKRAERFCQERDEARQYILGWENKWKFAVNMAARAELERDDALNKLKELKDILR